MLARVLGIAVSVCLAAPSSSPAAGRGEVLHRLSLLRAAPGRLPELVQALRASAASATPRPLVLRHSQGDHWDLLVLQPIGSYSAYFAKAPAPAAPAELVAWQEDLFARGPDLASLEGFLEAGLYHLEIFHAQAGKRDALLREREMENAYQRELGRPVTAVFARELGASWDAFTLGAYRGWKHYAERDDIAKERSAAAARAAGFESDEAIGPYLRSLIQDHHDTLLTPLR